MKETFRVYLRNNEQAVTFERFNCKTLKTVVRNMHILINNDLYRIAVSKFNRIEYYSVRENNLELLKIETL